MCIEEAGAFASSDGAHWKANPPSMLTSMLLMISIGRNVVILLESIVGYCSYGDRAF